MPTNKTDSGIKDTVAYGIHFPDTAEYVFFRSFLIIIHMPVSIEQTIVL